MAMGATSESKERKSDTHASTLGGLLMENRHGLILDAQTTVEREAATMMLSTHWRFAPPRHRTVGTDKA